GGRELLHSHNGAADQMFVVVTLRHVEGMMCDDNAHRGRRSVAETSRGAAHLLLVQPSGTAERQGTCAVQTDDDHFVVLKHGLEVGADVSAIGSVRVEEPGGDVEERHVVIAWDDQQGKRQPVEEGSRFPELCAPRTLREVSGYGNEI